MKTGKYQGVGNGCFSTLDTNRRGKFFLLFINLFWCLYNIIFLKNVHNVNP